MKTLQEHNAQRRKMRKHMKVGEARPNGIECPECGSQLRDTTPDETLTSDPPQKRVHCYNCDFTGTRVA